MRETGATGAEVTGLRPPFVIRPATPDDLPALRELIPVSVCALSQECYTPTQIESALRYVFGPDTQLIADGTYFVAVAGGGTPGEALAGCGGWSGRRTLYGGDQAKAAQADEADARLDPRTEAARVRAFFVHPDWARRGLATRLLDACIRDARAAGFGRLELVATLPGVPLYRACGFEAVESLEAALPDGVTVPFVRMTRLLPAR